MGFSMPGGAMATKLILNGRRVSVDAAPDMPLLWALRDVLGMTGTRFGCGAGQCGACTVIVDRAAMRACSVALGDLAGKQVRTIEGLADPKTRRLHRVQQAWVDCNVAQCGYCQAGQIMSAVALLETHPQPTDAQVTDAMNGNLCRCGTYPRVRAAIAQAAGGKA
ncbi:oxidoreductase subunit alpha [Pseudoduganella albidiflava]|uniref:Oxidoreductase subunit alpha n=2 Tax=Pseudoduganella albidiflava TaxID=321983 RepID=A0AA88C3H1_9BURK|nr:oxidoreductase subunit alpha [Pseudoduganella albidiflava]